MLDHQRLESNFATWTAKTDTHFRILNSLNYDVAQNRPWPYIVCVARGRSDAASRFAWPLPSAPSPGAILKRVIDKGSETLATHAQYQLPPPSRQMCQLAMPSVTL